MANRVRELDLDGLTQLQITRRSALKLSLGLIGTAASFSLLAACGDDDGDDDETAAGDTDDDAEEPATEDEGDDAEDEDDEDEPVDEPDEDEDDEDDADPEPDSDQHGGELTYALSADPPNLDPHIHTGTASRCVKLQVYNTLARYEDDGSLGPSLATDWEISDDGLDYSFQLRDDVTFHSGDQFTSDDVVATLERIQDEGVGAHRQSEMSAITDIETSDYEISFTLAAPNAPIMEYFAQPETSILSRAFIESGEDPNQTMMGTGPFTFVEHEPGVRLIVERNPDYFLNPLPYLDRIIFVPYPDENTRMAAVQGGDADMGDYVPWRDFEAIEDNPDLELIASEQSAFMCVMYNHRVEPFDDPAVRYALSFAYDYDAIADAAFFGRASAITGGLIPRGHWAFHDGIDGAHEYDPDRAQELLAEAGYPDGFSCTLMSTSQYGMHQNTAEIVQNNLQAIGVDCELELFDWATVVDRHAESDYQFRIQGTSADVNDPDFLTRFFGSGGNDARSYGFEDDEIDALLEEGRSLVTEDERREVYNQIEERLEELAVMAYLVYREDAEVVRSYVHDYHRLPGPLGFLSGVYLQNVWMDE